MSGATLVVDGTAIVDDVTFSITPGQLTALIGPNGAGKSSLLRLILGLEPHSKGQVTFGGIDLAAMGRAERAKLAAFVEQSAATDSRIDASEVVMLGRIPHQSMWSASSPEDDAAVAAALHLVGMTALAGRKYHTLSGGEQQRLHIARALAQQPRLMLLDEPTNHLDVHAQLSILGLLRRQVDAGVTALVALHDLNLAAGFDHLIVLKAGRMVAQGPPSAVLTPDLLRQVYDIEADILTNPRNGRPVIVYGQPVAR